MYKRRSFNAALCPTEYNPKTMGGDERGKNIGSPFNQWFRTRLKETGLNAKEFSKLIGISYSTLATWKYKQDPQIHGMVRIARGLESLGFGEYKELFKTIERLKRKK